VCHIYSTNAVIESARAGQQSRGFAVVADEIRTLTKRTPESTGQIAKIIEQLQNQSSETLKVMKSGLKQDGENVQLVSHAKSTFNNIRIAIEKNLQGATTIASAANEQNKTLNSIEQKRQSYQRSQ
jgi:methyl-accepting chemotaxis protein